MNSKTACQIGKMGRVLERFSTALRPGRGTVAIRRMTRPAGRQRDPLCRTFGGDADTPNLPNRDHIKPTNDQIGGVNVNFFLKNLEISLP